MGDGRGDVLCRRFMHSTTDGSSNERITHSTAYSAHGGTDSGPNTPYCGTDDCAHKESPCHLLWADGVWGHEGCECNEFDRIQRWRSE
jgi:hypothetical protein